MNRECFEALRAIDPELAFEYACLPDEDEYIVFAVDRNAGLCRLARNLDESPGDWIPLSRIHFKEWRNGPNNVGREPGYPGDIVTLAD